MFKEQYEQNRVVNDAVKELFKQPLLECLSGTQSKSGTVILHGRAETIKDDVRIL